MSEMLKFDFDLGDLTTFANQIKEITLNSLLEEGILTKDVADSWAEYHTVMIGKNHWFGQVWNSIKNRDKDKEKKTYAIHMVKATKIEGDKNAGNSTSKSDTSDLARFTPTA